jgi:ABC-type polysaccharide/polyol phosphate transport system ATPase subunit
MNDARPAITLRRLSKTYRLYARPSYRILDVLGLCPSSPRYFSEHTALHPIDLTIGRGEKVAIIGRNGAGKSTLLKLITGAATPTTGDIELAGRVSPLLQIGSGFHPEFTGRQNVFANLAHMGVVGREAARRFDEIVDFSELQQFIDQPMKTYSTGMGARLMFSTATSVEPEILVVDELLGVGDAYFAHKSFERMRTLCSDGGTTLLLVTHDLYSAMDLCERFIWIDRGEVRHDGDGRTTVAAYEASIKEQEEARLRARNRGSAAANETARVVVRSRSGFALEAPLWLERLELVAGNQHRAVPVASGSPEWHLAPESNLGPPETIDGRQARALQTFGHLFHKAEWVVTSVSPASISSLVVTWQYAGNDEAEVAVLDAENRPVLRGSLTRGDGWQTAHITSADEASEPSRGEYGTGAVRIVAVSFLDDTGAESASFVHGGRLRATVELERVQATSGDPACTFVLAFTRVGSTAAVYVQRDRVDVGAGRSVVSVDASPIVLGSGTWLVTLGVGEPDLYRETFNPYFTVNPRWFHLRARAFELQIASSSSIDAAATAVQPATVVVRPLPGAPA